MWLRSVFLGLSLTAGIAIGGQAGALQTPKDTNIVVPERLDFTYAASLARPSVVHIRTYSKTPNIGRMQSPFDDILKEFYGDNYKDNQKQEQGKDKVEAPKEYPIGAGSGVIMSNDGFIITNNHIAEKADRIEVVLNDKRSYDAKVIGTDPSTDLALIKIEEKELPAIKFGNSDQVKVGEWVLAVGNPFNLTSTVTAGIVSAKGRNINILREKSNMAIESFIQTDAAVNPGNSGGALVNIRGELIGINTAIASPTGAFAGYSFAVPVNLVKKVIEDLSKYGQAQRGLLGVMIQDITPVLMKEKGIKDYKGVYVASVNKNSAAEKAGLKEGDVILKINGTSVNSPAEIQEIVGLYRPGDKVKVNYRRDGKEYDTETILKNVSGNTDVVKNEAFSLNTKIGADLKELSREDLKVFKVQGGVKVVTVKSGKFKETGIREGFVITHIDKSPIRNVSEVEEIFKSTKEGGILIEGVYSNGEKAYYAIGF